jgi:ribonucleotide reductase beta subunit family protein with ferritin-like domain
MENKKSNLETPEYIFTETNRHATIPTDPLYDNIWKLYKQQIATIWVSEKITYGTDRKTYPTLPDDIKNSLEIILGFFATSDELVDKNLNERFLNEIKIPEICVALRFQAMMEDIHSEVYNTLIMTFLPLENDRTRLFNAVETIPAVTLKANWIEKWIASDRSYAHRCVAFACVEGIMFSVSFSFIDWIKSQGYKLPALTDSNDYISADEARHTEMSCAIYKHIQNKLTDTEAKEIIDDAINVELKFSNSVISSNGYMGMTRNLMSEHIYHCAALVSSMLGYPNLYENTKCPFPFMVNRGLYVKNNFFEVEPKNYSLITTNKNDEAFEILDEW